MRKILVTRSSGLIGSEIVEQFCQNGCLVPGIENNMRQNFFGPMDDTLWNQQRLCNKYPGHKHIELDIRDRGDLQHPNGLLSGEKQGRLSYLLLSNLNK